MPNLKIGFILLILVILCTLFIPPLIIFLVPGILILYLQQFNHRRLSELVIYVVALSLCYWIVSFWFTKFLPLTLTQFIYISAGVTIGVLSLFVLKKRNPVSAIYNKTEFYILAFLLFCLILRFLPMAFTIVPPGLDMSMHTYTAKLIAYNNSVPRSFRPILPIDSFSAYPVGFATVSALLSLVGKVEVYRAGYIFSCLTYAFLTMGLYILLLRFFDAKIAIASSFVCTFFTINPQNHMAWGTNPYLLSLFFCMVFLILLLNTKNNSGYFTIIFLSLTIASALLTHTIPVVGLMYILAASSILIIIMDYIKKRHIHISKQKI